MNDPIRIWRRRSVATGSFGAVAILAIGAWTARPYLLPQQSHNPAQENKSHGADDNSVVASFGEADPPLVFDRAAFESVQLWKAPPTSTPEHEQADRSAPPPKLDLDLLAIISENGAQRAAVYDKASERVRIVGAGDVITGFKVVEVTRSEVTLSNGRREATLSLSVSAGSLLHPAGRRNSSQGSILGAGSEHAR